MLVNINQSLWALIGIIIVLFIFEHLRTSVLHQDIEIRLHAQEALARSLAYIVCTFCSLPSLRGACISPSTPRTQLHVTLLFFFLLFFSHGRRKKKKDRCACIVLFIVHKYTGSVSLYKRAQTRLSHFLFVITICCDFLVFQNAIDGLWWWFSNWQRWSGIWRKEGGAYNDQNRCMPVFFKQKGAQRGS